MNSQRWRSLRESAPLIFPLVAAGAATARTFPPAAALAFLAAGGVTFAFRHPRRAVVRRPEIALAPADGRVIHIGPVWDDYWETELIEIAVFLALWDVHVQCSPMDGEVMAQHRRAGAYRAAMTHTARRGNNQLATYLATAAGPCTVTQISGFLARRIVSWAAPGDRLEQGESLGMIKFGSQVTLRLAPTSTVLVDVGQHVRAGLTPLAGLPEVEAARRPKENESPRSPVGNPAYRDSR